MTKRAKSNPIASERFARPTSLQRFSALVSQRDWIGVAIEIMVVTVGILVAFQIDQWGQERRQVREERQFLERMWRETAEAMQETEFAIRLHALARREFIEGLGARHDSAAMARLAATPNVGCRATSMPPLGFNDTTYQELSSSGRLNVVTDPTLSSELRDVVAAQADAVDQLSAARPLNIENQRALDPYSRLDLDEGGNRICFMDWPRLVRDQNARNAIARSARLHLLMWLKRAYTRDVLAKAHNRIACKLDKPDCRDRVPQLLGCRPISDVYPPDCVGANASNRPLEISQDGSAVR